MNKQTELHLYIPLNSVDTLEQATKRTDFIIDTLFDRFGYSVIEQGENDAVDNEIKTLLIVDTSPEEVETMLLNFGLDFQIYS